MKPVCVRLITLLLGLPHSGMVRYKDLVFHPLVLSHQGAILLRALGGHISVLWRHFFSSLFYIENGILCVIIRIVSMRQFY